MTTHSSRCDRSKRRYRSSHVREDEQAGFQARCVHLQSSECLGPRERLCHQASDA